METQIQLMPDAVVRHRYIKAGLAFAATFGVFGTRNQLGAAFEEWAKWEREYARRRYRTLPITDFIALQTEHRVKDALQTTRLTNESPTLYAAAFQATHMEALASR
jgi:hypothetical protein